MANLEKYVVVTDSRELEGTKIFLVDRKKTRRRWWSTKLTNAMQFRKKSAALYQSSRYKHNNPQVITLTEAKIIEDNNVFKEVLYNNTPTLNKNLNSW